MIRSVFIAPLALAALTSTALAHFRLIEPKAALVQAADGNPQKGKPCSTGTETTDVANYMREQTINITVKETIDHQGFYRVALAKDTASLPDVPAGACNTLTPQEPTTTILAGNMFVGLIGGPDSAPRTETVKLPNMNCQNCILQVIEVMTNDTGDCYYYHCAKVNIGTALPAPDAGPGPGSGPDAGPGDNNNSGGGSTGGCSASGAQAGWALLAFSAMLPLARRRRD